MVFLINDVLSPLQFWVALIADGAILLLFILCGVFLLMARGDLYSKAVIGIGALTLGEYLLIVGQLFSSAGPLSK